MNEPSPRGDTAPILGSGPTTSTPKRPLSADLVTAVMIGVGILAALAILAVFQIAPTALTALGVGVVFALALDPVLRATQRRLRCSRAVGTLVVGSVLTAVFAGVILLLGPQAAEQAEQFADQLPETVEEFYGWPIIGDRLEQADAVGRAEEFVDELPSRIDADTLSDAADRLIGNAATVVLVLITAVAVLFDGEALVARVRRIIPENRRERADEIGRIVYQSMARYFAGSVSVAILNGLVILTAGLVLGVPLAPLAAVWAMLTNLIPQIGGFLGGSFFVLLAVTQGALVGAIALAVFLAYQQTENHVIQPLVIGRAVDLSPLTTMLAALIGGAAAGVPGALVATPLIGAAKSVWTTTHAGPDSDGDDADDNADAEPSLLRRLLDRLRPSADAD